MTNSEKFPIEALARFPAPGMGVPNSFQFSADSKSLYFLAPSGATSPVQQLFVIDVDAGARELLFDASATQRTDEPLSLDEELRRQRLRMLSAGVTRFHYVKDSDTLLIPLSDSCFIYRGGELLQLQTGQPAKEVITPQLSPDGKWLGFVRDNDIHVMAVSDGSAQRITDATDGKSNGLADYVAQEELHRELGFWWAPNSEAIAFTEVDDTHIPSYRIMHQGKNQVDANAQEDHRYPFAGAENPHVRLGIVSREGGQVIWMNLDFDEEIYIVDAFWWPDGALGAICLNRPQNHSFVLRFDNKTGERSVVYEERNEFWFTYRAKDFTPLEDGRLLLVSPRTGYRHLYIYDPSDQQTTALTSGDWAIDAICAADMARGNIYFTASEVSPTERHVYQVDFSGANLKRISSGSGFYGAVIDPGFKHLVMSFSSMNTPPTVKLYDLDNAELRHVIHETQDTRISDYGLTPPELVQLTAEDGTLLYGAIYRPPESYGSGPFPTVVHVYGGPGPQMVANHWGMTAVLDIQYLRNQGFLVFRLDNRGSARRGLQFEGALKHRMGTVEVEDQARGVRWLVEQGLADPKRVGIFGWSYGGYMSLMCLMQRSDIFSVAVSGAPVTHWDGYDTCYTERYMGTPQDNPQGYEQGSVMTYVDKLEGRLFLIHGMLDENVHFRHTARLMNALNRARKRYDVLLLPDERHSPRNPMDRVYLYERIVEYFKENL